MCILPTKTPSASGRISARTRAAFNRLIQQYLDEMDPAIPVGINYAPEDDLAVAGISQIDGTAGISPRPPFVVEDDERISQ